MHGCKNNIGCLQGSIERVGKGLNGNLLRIGQCLQGRIERVGEGLNGSVTLVCSVNRDVYLRVVPDVVWLTTDMLSGEFDIYSNVVWRID